jgi:hypothetical protein
LLLRVKAGIWSLAGRPVSARLAVFDCVFSDFVRFHHQNHSFRCILRKLILFAATTAALVQPLPAQTLDCRNRHCAAAYRLSSDSDLRSYGILIAAPDSGCARVRFRVETAAAGFLGHTPPLGPGELAVVRLGRGFSPGEHWLTIASEGCESTPAATRRVILAKASPDHGWRLSP